MSLAIGTIGRYGDHLALVDGNNADGSYDLLVLSYPQTQRLTNVDASDFANPNPAPAPSQPLTAPSTSTPAPTDSSGQAPA